MDKDLHQGNLAVVHSTLLHHLGLAVVCFFHFKFIGFFIEIMWLFEKAFRIGDFGPNGYFTINGYIKDGYILPDTRTETETEDSSSH